MLTHRFFDVLPGGGVGRVVDVARGWAANVAAVVVVPKDRVAGAHVRERDAF